MDARAYGGAVTCGRRRGCPGGRGIVANLSARKYALLRRDRLESGARRRGLAVKKEALIFYLPSALRKALEAILKLYWYFFYVSKV